MTPIDRIFDDWKRITRFFRSSRIAFTSEAQKWQALHAGAQPPLRHEEDQSSYEVSVDDHLAVLADENLLCGMVLTHSYALFESYCSDLASELNQAQGLNLAIAGGIEAWAPPLLGACGHNFGEVLHGLVGLVEAATVRNAIAHGEQIVTQNMVARMQNSAGALPWPLGTPMALTFPLTKLYRDRLRSFLRYTQDAWR